MTTVVERKRARIERVEKPTAAIAASGPTPLGHFAVGVAGGVLHAVAMGRTTEIQARQSVAKLLAERCATLPPVSDDDERLASRLIERLVEYADGVEDDFADVEVALDHLSPFQKRVASACRRIPIGRTRTYGELAAIAGSPGAARAVGQVMATNRVPIVVPCHRVVAAGGGLGGFSAPTGITLKRQLLDMEAASK